MHNSNPALQAELNIGTENIVRLCHLEIFLFHVRDEELTDIHVLKLRMICEAIGNKCLNTVYIILCEQSFFDAAIFQYLLLLFQLSI